jgi:hypothetical protein
MTIFEHRHPSEHPADDVWRAIDTPLSETLAAAIHPWFEIAYAGLSEEVQIERGTHIIYIPKGVLIDMVPQPLRVKIPKDIKLRVEDHNAQDRSRVDVLESGRAEGTIRHRVEEAEGGTGLLVVEGELAIRGSAAMAEGPAIQYGIYEPTQRLLEHMPEILAS